MNLCINCKHCIRDAAKPTEFSRCERRVIIEPVAGHKTLVFCSVERQDIREHYCGPRGAFFAAKPA